MTAPLEPLEMRLLMARLQGIDVSQFQGGMNFTTAYNFGDRFAFIRASRTDTVPDTAVDTFVPAAKAAGLVVGVYHRMLPFSNTSDNGEFMDPIVDADNFVSAGGLYMGEGYIRPVLDVENGAILNSSPVNGYTLNGWVIAFLNRVQQRTGVTPMVYANTNYTNIMNTTPSVPAVAPDIWVANWTTTTYGDPINGTGNPPAGAWGTGSGWDFWQYGSTGVGSDHGAASARIDTDVFNGTDINVLKQNYVTGAAHIPTGPNPADQAADVPYNGVVLDWDNAPGATRYDIYLDNPQTPAATNLTVSQWTIPYTLTGGVHTWHVVAKTASSETGTQVSSPTWSFTALTMPPPALPSNPTPSNNGYVNSKPVMLDWDDSPNAQVYDLYLGGSSTPTATNLTVSEFGPINPFDGLRLWRVVAKNVNAWVTGPQWQYTMDTVAPTASYGGQTPVAGGSALSFTVTYGDATAGMDTSSFGNGDVRITGPNAFAADASFVSASGNVVTYSIAAPGGSWDFFDNGNYTVSQNANEVKDLASNFRPAGSIGSFNFNVPVPFAYMSGPTFVVQFDGTAPPIQLSSSGSIIIATRNGTNLTFSGVASINAFGSSADDRLQISAPLAPPMTFNNGTGNDTIEIVGGTYAFSGDAGGPNRNVGVLVASGAAAVFNATQHLRSLSVNGTATLSANGDKVLVTKSLAVTGKLNLTNNDLVVDYTGQSPIGSWSGSAYTGITGLLQTGRNGGAWNGNGIITDQSNAIAPNVLTTLSIAEASESIGASDAATALFGTEPVDGTAVLVKYTWSGDVNLDGILNGDDYFQIDSHFNQSGAIFGAYNGDYNLDGAINGDDYFLIDSTWNAGSTGAIL